MSTLVYEDFPGTSTTYPVNFEYLNPNDVKVGSITTEEVLTPILTGWSLTDATTITFDSTPGGTIRIYRVTPIDEPVATFFPTVAIRAIDLNNNFDQCLFALQEIESDTTQINVNLDELQDQIDTLDEKVDTEVDKLEDQINDLSEALAEVSGIEILANVAALNSFTPPANSVGSAVQVSDSNQWPFAQGVTGTPAGFIGGPDIRVNLRITQVSPPGYTFITYQRVDPDAAYVLVSGDTMTGALTLSGAPTADLQAATKKYVDDAVVSDSNTTYDFGSVGNGDNVQLQLVGSDSSADIVTLTKGSNITFTNVTTSGFTINSTGGGSGGLTSVDLGYSNGTITNDAGTNATIPDATTTAKGLLTAADKTKLDSAATTSDLSSYVKANFTLYPLLP